MKTIALSLLILSLFLGLFALVAHDTIIYSDGIGVVLYAGTIVRVVESDGDYCLVAWGARTGRVACDNLRILR